LTKLISHVPFNRCFLKLEFFNRIGRWATFGWSSSTGRCLPSHTRIASDQLSGLPGAHLVARYLPFPPVDAKALSFVVLALGLSKTGTRPGATIPSQPDAMFTMADIGKGLPMR
jgi:hypothetical protein